MESVIALGFRYPHPGSLQELGESVRSLPAGSVRSRMDRFLEAVGRLELGEWEELHTRTLDLSPLVVPYVGHVIWGENYRRGEFMADLKRAELAAGVDPGGELPDHLEPVLRYLAAATAPLPDLMAVLPQAIEKMRSELAKAERKNPYRHLLAAAADAVDEVVEAMEGANA